MDYSPPGSSVHELLQARILELVAMPSLEHLRDPDIEPASTASSALADKFFTTVQPYVTETLENLVTFQNS